MSLASVDSAFVCVLRHENVVSFVVGVKIDRTSTSGWPASQLHARLRRMRTERVDFRATSDPALNEAADRGEAQLLTYTELYELWERQQWATQDIDFTQDRVDWHERMDAEERFQRMYGLSSFFVGEQRVAAELGPMMRACPDEDMRLFLCTQIADEARHVAFFDRFYTRGRRAGVRQPAGAPGGGRPTPQPGVRRALRRAAAAPGRPAGARRPTTSRRWSRP